MKNKIKIFSLLFFLILFCSICIIFYFKDSKYVKINYEKLKQKIIINKIKDDNIAKSITINNVVCMYDDKSKTYYYSISSNEANKKIKLNIKVVSKNSVKFIINGYVNKFNKKIDTSKKAKILIYDAKKYFEYKIVFTQLPLMNINVKDDINDINDVNGNVILNDVNYYNRNKQLNYEYKSSINIHVRGNYSKLFDKKSYKLELIGSKYPLLNMRKDDDWVLDAIYADSSKIRNKLSSDIWNQINNNQNINNDLQGEFIELFINNEYRGLYLLKEPVDKKTVMLDDDGILIKIIHSFSDEDNEYLKNYKRYKNLYNLNQKIIRNLEVKYPKGNYDWNSFLSKFSLSYDLKDKDYSIDNSYDQNNYVNYNLFLLIINGYDNLKTNHYFSLKNQKSNILITPWDMDITFGNKYSANGTKNLSSYSDDELIEKILTSDTPKYNNLIKKRYFELRKDILTMDNLNKLLDQYLDTLTISNATIRDSEKWYDYDIEKEIEGIRDWIYNRLNYLDKKLQINYCEL